MRGLLLIASLLILNPLTDASKIYHTIRGQDTIKLYVIFNALEVGNLGLDLPNGFADGLRSRIGCVPR